MNKPQSGERTNRAAIAAHLDNLKADHDLPRSRTQARLRQKLRVHALQYASEDLRHDREIIITACLNHGVGALQHCNDEKLKKELQGLSKAQLRELLKTANDPTPEPSVWDAPPDTDTVPEMPTKASTGDGASNFCLLCYDKGKLCETCAAQRPSVPEAPSKDPGTSNSSSMEPPRELGASSESSSRVAAGARVESGAAVDHGTGAEYWY